MPSERLLDRPSSCIAVDQRGAPNDNVRTNDFGKPFGTVTPDNFDATFNVNVMAQL